MTRLSFFWKLFLGYIALIIFCTVATGIIVTRWMGNEAEENMRQGLHDKATLARDFAARTLKSHENGSYDPLLQIEAKSLGEEIQTRITVVNNEGRVLADSGASPPEMDNQKNRPEIRDALSQGQGSSIRFSNTLKEELLYVALPVEERGEVLGVVRCAHPVALLQARMRELRINFLYGALLAILASLILGYVFARRITAPLSRMTRAANAMVEGNYEYPLHVTSQDELGVLATAFNKMRTALSGRLEEVTSDRNQLATILASMVEGVVAVDSKERILHINKVAVELFDVDAESVIGRKAWKVLRNNQFTEAIRRTIEGNLEHGMELKFPAPNQQLIVSLQTSPLRDAAGNPSGAVAVMHDITTMRKLENMRRDFVSNASHELKTPLTAIRGLTETLTDDPAMDIDTRERFLKGILSESQRLGALVSDMVTLSRIESQEVLELDGQARMNDVVRMSADNYLPAAEGRGVELIEEKPEEPLFVRGDTESLVQATRNLLDNAIKYSGGSKVWVRLRTDGTHAYIDVEDNGIGIKPEHHARIFQRFYRVDKARSRELGGTGLGLAIVKHIVLAHHGEVSLKSQPGRGSSFTIKLPIASATAPVEEKTSAAS